MRVLVTGATGFIGREIVRELSKNNIEVIKVSSPKSESKNIRENRRSNFYAADITNYENLAKLEKLGEIDAVIHAAGLAHQFGKIDKPKFDAVNVEGTKNVARLADVLRVRQFLLISSTAIYGIKKASDGSNEKTKIIIDENTDCQPQTLYAESKLEAERAAIKICEKKKIALTILRLAPVIGEGNVGNAARLVSAIDNGRFVWIGKGENLKTLIYKTDVARACIKILTAKNDATEIFNVAAEPISMKELVGQIANHLDKKIPRFSIPTSFLNFLNFLKIVFQLNTKLDGLKKIDKISETVEKWLSDDIYAAKKIEKVYGFQPKFSIAEAIKRQVTWYKSEKPPKHR